MMRTSRPRRLSSMAAVIPVGPAPTIRIEESVMKHSWRFNTTIKDAVVREEAVWCSDRENRAWGVATYLGMQLTSDLQEARRLLCSPQSRRLQWDETSLTRDFRYATFRRSNPPDELH